MTISDINDAEDITDFLKLITEKNVYEIGIDHQDIGLSVETLYNYKDPDNVTKTGQAYGALWDNATLPVDTMHITTVAGGSITLDAQNVYGVLQNKEFWFVYKDCFCVPSAHVTAITSAYWYDDLRDLLSIIGMKLCSYTTSSKSTSAVQTIDISGPGLGIPELPAGSQIISAYWSFQGYGVTKKGSQYSTSRIVENTPSIISSATPIGSIAFNLLSISGSSGSGIRYNLTEVGGNYSGTVDIRAIEQLNKLSYKEGSTTKTVTLADQSGSIRDFASGERTAWDIGMFGDIRAAFSSLRVGYVVNTLSQRVSSNTSGINAIQDDVNSVGAYAEENFASLDGRVSALEENVPGPGTSDSDLKYLRG